MVAYQQSNLQLMLIPTLANHFKLLLVTPFGQAAGGHTGFNTFASATEASSFPGNPPPIPASMLELHPQLF